jgi:hypothetical protein
VLNPPGGTIYLADGRLSHAECSLACGVNRLVTASGRLSMAEFRTALAAGRASRDMAWELTRPGLLMPSEVEVVFHTALYGAAHFLFDARSEVRFEMGAHHPMGTVIDIDLETVRTEIDRRRRALHHAWPDATVDSLPVVPARRLDGPNVSLNALQWEIVVAAGHRRTPVDLARALGRDSYATLLNARRLLRSGLLQVSRTASTSAQAIATSAQAAPRTHTPPITSRSGTSGRRATETANQNVRLPHRDGPSRSEWSDMDTAWSETTLARIRDALQALP